MSSETRQERKKRNKGEYAKVKLSSASQIQEKEQESNFKGTEVVPGSDDE